MKTKTIHSFAAAFAFLGLLVLAGSAGAQVTVINSSASGAGISFVDTNSFTPSFQEGSLYYSYGANPWPGGTVSLPSTTDLKTSDTAQGDLTVQVAFGNYSIAINNVTLDQNSANSGNANLIFAFTNQFQLGALGLPTQATVYPDFSINGTIQSGGFASVTGAIKYFGSPAPNVTNVLDTVTYNYFNNNSGPLSGFVNGVPVTGTTPTLIPNSTLEVIGIIDFEVDPADITVETVPEPGSGLLLGLAGVAGLLWRRRRSPD